MKKHIAQVGLVLVFLIIMAPIITIYLKLGVTSGDSQYQTLDEGWTVQINDTVYQDSTIGKLSFPLVNKGDTVIMERVLPEGQISCPELIFYSVHAVVHVELDGVEIYSYGEEKYAQGKMVGYGYHFAPLPDDYSAKTVRITMQITEDNAFSALEIPQIYNSRYWHSDFMAINRLPLAMILFLIVFGLCIACVSAWFSLRDFKFLRLCSVGFFSLGMGLWTLCNYDLIFLFVDNPYLKTVVEYWTLYTFPMFAFFYFRTPAMAYGNRVARIVYNVILAFQGIFLLAVGFLQVTNIRHLPELLKWQHIIMVEMCVYILILYGFRIFKRKLNNWVMLVGILIMMGFIILDLVRFSMSKYLPDFAGMRFVSYSCVGIMIFVVAQIAEFCMEIWQKAYEGAQAEALERMAYTDALTAIANRRKCEDILDEAEKWQTIYGVISLDLNELKKMNDTYGHDAGDRMIRTFSKVLEEVFGKIGTVGRMGGDEFIVIIPDIKKISMQELKENLERKLKEVDEREHLKLSAAFGFCGVNESEVSNAWECYKKADVRMYEMKRKMKQEIR
jgi:diguanylate cyclase (GGDEF)-like protein